MERQLEIGIYRHFKHGDLYITHGSNMINTSKASSDFKLVFLVRREGTEVLYPVLKDSEGVFIILNISIDGTQSSVNETFCIYQALYGDKIHYIRPLDEFLSETDKVKYPNSVQDLRFEYLGENLKSSNYR